MLFLTIQFQISRYLKLRLPSLGLCFDSSILDLQLLPLHAPSCAASGFRSSSFWNFVLIHRILAFPPSPVDPQLLILWLPSLLQLRNSGFDPSAPNPLALNPSASDRLLDIDTNGSTIPPRTPQPNMNPACHLACPYPGSPLPPICYRCRCP